MKRHIITLCVAALMTVAQSFGGVTLTVPEVSVAPGGTSYVVINYSLGTQHYTAYQMDIAYPSGITSVAADDGNPAFIKGEVYSDGTDGHGVSSIHTSTGKDRFQCFSVNSLPLTAQDGTLLILPITAQRTLTEGLYQATISPIEFVQTDATPFRPEAITFNIKVTKNLVLDEISRIAPPSGPGVNVTVKRSINANEWSTICLPFAMTEAQTKAAFGNDVKIADFTGYQVIEDDDEEVVGIKVIFEQVTEMEANHPYILKVSTAIRYDNGFSLSSVTIDPVNEPAINKGSNRKPKKIVGVYKADTTVPEYALFLSGNKFWYSKGLTKMKAFRAYFSFYDVLSELDGAAARISMSVDGEPTGIGALLNDEEQLDDNVYDLQGRNVQRSSVKKGLYLQEGTKVIINNRR